MASTNDQNDSSINKQLSSNDSLHVPLLPFNLVPQILCSEEEGYDQINNGSNPNIDSSDDSLHRPPLPTLPPDLIAEEILTRLPVKLLLQLRCVCKSWNSQISNPKFAKKHLSLSTINRIHFVSYARCYSDYKYFLTSYPLESVFTDVNTNVSKFEYSSNSIDGHSLISVDYFIGSCNGILCIADNYEGLVILWNPSIRQFKELPLFEKPLVLSHIHLKFGFGYDSLRDNYKVIVVLKYKILDSIEKTEVKVHTLGTNIWRSIQEFPFGVVPLETSGKFVSGTINWLAFNDSGPCFIVAFDLGKESYQKVLLPNYEGVNVYGFSTLGVLRGCLCLTHGEDVWVMEEYGNRESWTKLFTISYMGDPMYCNVRVKPVYMFEDGQVLLTFRGSSKKFTLLVFDCRNGNSKSTNLQDIPEVCVESLISLYS